MKQLVIVLLACMFTALFATLENIEFVDLGDVIPTGLMSLGEHKYLVYGGRAIRIVSIENDEVEVLSTLFTEKRYYDCEIVTADTLVFSSYHNGYDFYRWDDDGLHYLNTILDDIPEETYHELYSTSVIGDTLLTCRYLVDLSGVERFRWDIVDIADIYSPQIIQSTEMSTEQALVQAFRLNGYYYFLEIASAIKFCEDLSTFELSSALTDWPTGQIVVYATLADSLLYVTLYYDGDSWLSVYSSSEDGSLIAVASTPSVDAYPAKVFVGGEQVIVSVHQDGGIRLYRYSWEDGSLVLAGESVLPDEAYSCSLLASDDGYLLATSCDLFRLNSDFEVEATLLTSRAFWLQEVKDGRYLLLKTSADVSELENHYLIFDLVTRSFIYDTDHYHSFNNQRYGSDHWTFKSDGACLETVYLGDDGIESIQQLTLPSDYINADIYDDLICYSAYNGSEVIFHLGRIDDNEVEELGEFNPDYYTNTAMFLDPNHLVIEENYAYNPNLHFYRIEDDYSFTEVATIPNWSGLYITDSRIAPGVYGNSPVDISDKDNPFAMDAFSPSVFYDGCTYIPSYNGDGCFALADQGNYTYITDEDFQVLSRYTDGRMLFIGGNQVALSDGTTLLLGTLSEVPVVDDPLPPPAAPALRAWPTPFNPSTSVSFNLSQPGRAQLAVYNVRGQRVRTLVDEPLPAGEHTAVWNARDDAGRTVASGVYLLRLQTAGQAQTSKVLLLK